MNQLVKRIFRFISPEIAYHTSQLFREIKISYNHYSGTQKAVVFKGYNNLKLNLGCGYCKKPGFVNIDYKQSADIRLDLRKPLPFTDGSCVLIFSEHFIEHLNFPEGLENFLTDCYRLLCHGGLIKLSVPDTRWPLATFCKNSDEWVKVCERHGWHPDGCNTFMEHLNFHFRQRWRGMHESDFTCHRFAFDYETLEKKLLEVGFVNIHQRNFDLFLDNENRKEGSLFVQAEKP